MERIDRSKYRVRDLRLLDVGQYSRICCNNHTAVSCRCLDMVQENAIISALARLFCHDYVTRQIGHRLCWPYHVYSLEISLLFILPSFTIGFNAFILPPNKGFYLNKLFVTADASDPWLLLIFFETF